MTEDEDGRHGDESDGQLLARARRQAGMRPYLRAAAPVLPHLDHAESPSSTAHAPRTRTDP
ncbi:hypothetical protein STTU_6464 [Streptomyces sp. Tu6071]|nr:hypothetical protein STTU_6464 [Streptomyces sp. Tu6071]